MNDSYGNAQSNIETFHANGGIFLSDCSSLSLPKEALLIYIRTVVQASLMFIAVLMNITIIAVVCCTKNLRTVTHFFISSLACSDLITASIIFACSCIVISSLSGNRTCGLTASLVCFKGFLTFFSVTSSIGNHLLISIERWLYIARPFLHQRIINPRTTTGCVISMWVISFLFNINVLFDRCGSVKFSTRVNNGIVKPALNFFLCFLMCIIYSHIAFISYQQVKTINKLRVTSGCTEDETVLKTRTLVTMRWKTIRMLTTVFGVYFILVPPLFCIDIYAYAADQSIYDTFFGKIVNLIWSVHCCLNVCIYAAQDRVFRNALKTVLQKKCNVCCRRNVHPDTTFSCGTIKM
ncbi:unnamed protein product [Candidula unifasciata]|uniref:G-protein coupled receptors family 1 profile domain-containing protein n=1 Tax=Candidula unifasciata TaxID=100452 RepID=A0A8S3ZGJ3_9EUPU|nr:unnamed protein product [Candidula unifasciata]